jgi:hypothetical protein
MERDGAGGGAGRGAKSSMAERPGPGSGGPAIGSPSEWPVMPKDAVYDGEARQRRAFGGERRTVAVRRLDRGDR